jgi:hypothetical protein
VSEWSLSVALRLLSMADCAFSREDLVDHWEKDAAKQKISSPSKVEALLRECPECKEKGTKHKPGQLLLLYSFLYSTVFSCPLTSARHVCICVC